METCQTHCKQLWKPPSDVFDTSCFFCSMFLFSKRCFKCLLFLSLTEVIKIKSRLLIWIPRVLTQEKLLCSLPKYYPILWGRRRWVSGLFHWNCSVKWIYCVTELAVFLQRHVVSSNSRNFEYKCEITPLSFFQIFISIFFTSNSTIF